MGGFRRKLGPKRKGGGPLLFAFKLFEPEMQRQLKIPPEWQALSFLASCVPRQVKVKVKVTQSCPTLCDPMDYTVRGILQAKILEWIAFSFSRGSSQLRD